MKTKYFKYASLVSVASISLVPVLSYAASGPTFTTLVGQIVRYFNTGIYIIMSLAVIAFVWNVFNYFIVNGDNPTDRAESGKYVLYSIVGFFIILSFWGLVNIVTNTFQLNNRAPSAGYFNSSGSSGGGSGSSVFGNYDSEANLGVQSPASSRGVFGRAYDWLTGSSQPR